jgi:hypothetical protein
MFYVPGRFPDKGFGTALMLLGPIMIVGWSGGYTVGIEDLILALIVLVPFCVEVVS